MTQPSSPGDQDQTVFLELAQLVNSLPLDKRVSIRNFLGEYTHDLKHLIGLVTNANAILARQQEELVNKDVVLEMVGLIVEASMQIDSQIDRLTEYLGQNILLED